MTPPSDDRPSASADSAEGIGPASAPDAARVEEAFSAALDLAPPARIAHLAELRLRDRALADEVESLLRYATDSPEDPLATPGPPTLTLPPSLVGETVGGCRIERLLGYGGMSAVYRATQEFPRRAVAVKLVRPERLGDSARRRLRVEAEALARLSHPGIARVYSAGAERLGRAHAAARETPYLVMELVEGARPLSKWCDEHALAPAERIAIVARIADAIAHAHRAGVIHRDLKPGNVLVGADGIPKVIDFGIAAVADPTVTLATEGPMGTLAYMSPEQARGRDIDTRSDVWGLGALLYDLLAGTPPFDAQGVALAAHLERLLHEAPEPPVAVARRTRGAAFAEAIPPAADAVVAKALATDPERRYAGAGEFAAELRRLLRGEPLLARPESEWHAILRLVRRHRAPLVAATGIAIATIGALAVSLTLLDRERAAHARAENAAYTAALSAANAMAARGDASAARELLATAPESLRGWEWNALDRLTDQRLASVAFPEGHQVYGLDLSPDGRTLFAAASGWVSAIDVSGPPGAEPAPATPRERWRVAIGDGEPAWRVAALDDGSVVVVRMAEGLVRFDAGGRELARADFVNAVDLAIDGGCRTLWVTDAGGAAAFDPRTLEPLRTIGANPALAAFPRAIAVSPDGTTIVLGDQSGATTAIDAGTGDTRWRWTPPTDAHEVRGVAFSPDGTRVVGAGERHVFVLDAVTGEPLWHRIDTTRFHRSPRFTPDGREVLAATYQETVERLDAATGERIASVFGAASQVWTVEPLGDGSGFATGSFLARVDFHASDATGAPRETLLDGTPVHALAPPAPGDRRGDAPIHAITAAGGLFAIDPATGIATRREAPPGARAAIALDDGGLLVGHRAGLARLAPDGELAAFGERMPAIERLAPVDGGRLIAARTADGHTRFVSLADGRTVADIDRCEGLSSPAADLARASDGAARVFVPGGQGGIARVVDLASGSSRVAESVPEHPMVAARSPDGRTLAIGSFAQAGEVALVDARTLAPRRAFANHRSAAFRLAWSPDGTRLASSGLDDTVRIWDPARDDASAEVLVAWRGRVRDLAWDRADRLWLACEDGRVRVLDGSPRARK